MSQNNPRLGIFLMILTTFVFAMQDGISRHLAENYNVLLVVMIRYWFFVVFVLAYASMQKGGIRRVARSGMPILQFLRGVLLAAEICVTVLAYVYLGLIETHAIFAIFPLIVVALAGPMLGESVGWRRWAAVGVGCIGMLIILKPDNASFSAGSLIALSGAFMFAVYQLLTRYVARVDHAMTSFFWTGVGGSVVMTLIGPFYWEPIAPADQLWMALLCVTGATGHFLLIKTLEVAEAAVVQPFTYFQIVFVSAIGLTVFGEKVGLNVVVGALIIIAAGLFVTWRERVRAAQRRSSRV